MVPMLLFLWCMHNMCMVDGSIPALFSFGGMIGSLYVTICAGICAITCVSEKGPKYGVLFLYHLLSGMVSIKMILWSFFAANLAQCMVVLAPFSL